MKIYDISMPLYNGVPNWPGDTPYAFDLPWTKEQSGSVNVGRLEMSTHTGTHIDAPFHFDNEGKRVIDLPLDLYTGPALVIDVTGSKEITAESIDGRLTNGTKRVIFKTSCWSDRTTFPDQIVPISSEVVPLLKVQGVGLIGVDMPSVDPLDSKELQAHHALHQHNIHILEGLLLDDVPEGEYELIALPLPLQEGDGSPVRAILKERS
ncbi:arylformamidase [Fictibacillus phosphorivorans]|uniref:arylformamidase n=1 Tax=Fictibacillus phosphorivorans TaxID=1221500 RepID=UPI00204222EE|nr:arylformamidase [Fictibacillus phosphorivorans]MCM3718745.1 arylformamidase [Fictibacillus phosphorivorans]MCM3776368.1 arylformamidase [Fictibacillus phosphorivorans]